MQKMLFDGHEDNEFQEKGVPFRMRQECSNCGCEEGIIKSKGGQDCVYCECCEEWRYNAPRVETGRAVRSIQSTHRGIKSKQRARTLLQANGRCELCGADGGQAGLHVGHIISVKNGHKLGMSDAEINHDQNLVALCAECNLGIGDETIPLEIAQQIRSRRSGHNQRRVG